MNGRELGPLDVLRRLWKACDPAFLVGPKVDERAVLSAILVHANNAPEWFAAVSLDTLAKDTNMGRATVVRALTRLERRGLITRDRKPPRLTRYRIAGAAIDSLSLIQSQPETVSPRARHSLTVIHELPALPTKVVEGENLCVCAGAGARENGTRQPTVYPPDERADETPADAEDLAL